MNKEKRPGKKRGKGSELRKQVEARIEKEASKYPEAKSENGKVNSAFVRQCLKANELGDGLLFKALLREHFIFNNTTGEWLRFNGHYWEKDIMEAGLASVEVVVDRLITEMTQLSDEIRWNQQKKDEQAVEALQNLHRVIAKRIHRLRTDRGRNMSLKFARISNDPMAIRGDELDNDPWLLACKNGVIDLRSGKFRDGRPDDYLSMASPIEWQGLQEPCKLWEKTLGEIFEGHEEIIPFMKQLFGYSITGLTIKHVFPVLWGRRGRNGKDVITGVISRVLGPLASPIPSEMLLDQGRTRNPGGPSPDIMMLKGLRIAVGSETDQARRFSPARIKWLSGGGQLTGRSPHDKHPLTFIPSHTLFLLSNEKPSAPGDDFAFWERLILIPFHWSFVPREPVKEFEKRAREGLGDDIFQSEAPGVLAWLAQGCLDYQRYGLDPPTIIKDETANYQQDEDILGNFLDRYCIVDQFASSMFSELFDKFTNWYHENISSKDPTAKYFASLLSKRFEKKQKYGLSMYLGIRLKRADEFEHDRED